VVAEVSVLLVVPLGMVAEVFVVPVVAVVALVEVVSVADVAEAPDDVTPVSVAAVSVFAFSSLWHASARSATQAIAASVSRNDFFIGAFSESGIAML
jgi:hypothetical protein